MKVDRRVFLTSSLALAGCVGPVMSMYVDAYTGASKYNPVFYSESDFKDWASQVETVSGTAVNDSSGVHFFNTYTDDQVIYNTKYLARVTISGDINGARMKVVSGRGVLAPIFVIRDSSGSLKMDINWDATKTLHKKLSKILKIADISLTKKFGELYVSHINKSIDRHADKTNDQLTNNKGGLFGSVGSALSFTVPGLFDEFYGADVMRAISKEADYIIDYSISVASTYFMLMITDRDMELKRPMIMKMGSRGAESFEVLYKLMRSNVLIQMYNLASNAEGKFFDTLYQTNNIGPHERQVGRSFMSTRVIDANAYPGLIPKMSDPLGSYGSVVAEDAKNRTMVAEVYSSSMNLAIKSLDVPGLIEKKRNEFIVSNSAVMSNYTVKVLDEALPVIFKAGSRL